MLKFGDPQSQIPLSYCKNLVRKILTANPRLAHDMTALWAEVQRVKGYEVRLDSVTKYARLFKAGQL